MASITRKGNTTTTTTYTNIPNEERKVQPMAKQEKQDVVIAFNGDYLRKNENRLVWDIRDNMKKGDVTTLQYNVKTWLNMVNHAVPEDKQVKAVITVLNAVFYTGKGATVKAKEDKKATIDCISIGRVKAWLYSANEGRIDFVDTHETTAPELKAGKAKKAPSEKQVAKIIEMFNNGTLSMVDGKIVVNG